MDEILEFLLKHASFLYRDHKFRFADSAISDSFGDAVLVMESPDFNLRFCRDRGRLHLEFQSNALPRDDADSWYSIELVRYVITKEDQFRGILDQDNAMFLQAHYNDIRNMFSEKQIYETVDKLKHAKHIRAKHIFAS